MRYLGRGLLIGLIFLKMFNPGGIRAENFLMTPPFSDIEILPGEKQVNVEIEIGNQTDKETTFEISVVDFGSLDETGGLAFITTDNDNSQRKYSLASWISPEKESITIMPNSKEKIKITILNKESLSPGGHYGAVMATVKSKNDNGKDSVGINQTLASLVYVLKTGGEIRNLNLKSAEMKKNIFIFPKTIALRFWNSGNAHVIPRGTVKIKNGQGEIVEKGIVNEGSVKVLPESYRIIETGLKRIKKWNWPGKYVVEVDYHFDKSEKTETETETYWYFGYEGILIVMIISLITTLFLVRIH